jgi:hypothetical protein
MERSHVESAAGDDGAGEATVTQVVLRNELELAAGLEDKHPAFFVMASPAFPSAVETKTRSPHRQGAAWPSPGMSIRQITLSVFDQRTGGRGPRAWPSNVGPRHQGQSVSATVIPVGVSIVVASLPRSAL